MDRFDDDALSAELRAVRPTPRPEFAAELDATPSARLADRRRALSPRRRLVPVLAVALAALVVATGVVAIAGSGGSNRSIADTMTSGPSESSSGLEEGGGAAAEETESFSEESAEGAIEAEPEAEGTEHSGEVAPKAAESGTAEVEESAGAEEGFAPEEGAESAEALVAPVPPMAQSVGRGGGRDIERSAYVVLGTKPGEVGGAAAKVYEAVHAANGVVLHSSVKSGSAGATGATFELLIPSAKLDDTLAAFSQIAEVRERHDATNDITKQTVGADEELVDSNATIESLLKELGDAETETEREALETRLREERRRHAAIGTSLDHLHKRATMSEVSVRIVTDKGAGVTPVAKASGGDWSVGDALHDAGRILTIAAGILLVALAILAPIALIALLAWIANRTRVRRLRERTLG
jgi:Domain of unknown function (DUF4349)